ncbi:hypothetical protein P0136_12990 [Lentisphaerota bacterium ZTH]|nr:hypothetical protein JYG24_09495 [Lentisphaerota bacterium]WET06274.1 hypothetical protein P0136_12990 [Lentisphaerota bacterium ZTH]
MNRLLCIAAAAILLPSLCDAANLNGKSGLSGGINEDATGNKAVDNTGNGLPSSKKIVKSGEKQILFPDNFSNPYSQLDGKTKSRTVHFIQNDAQPQMVSKVYKLKYLRAADLTPFILGAVKRFSPQSSVERLNYKYGKIQYLLVNTGQQMMPYVDEMVRQLDRPGLKDKTGSLVDSTGIARGAYRPRYRSGDDFVSILNSSVVGQGYVWNNLNSNVIYWKTDRYHSDEKVRHWLEYLDRPLPQVRLTFKVYEIRESKLHDLGIDYNAWKNGPGLNIFNFSFQDLFASTSGNFINYLTSQSVNLAGTSNFAWGGMFFAPAFDMSFIRMLSQNGKADVAATGTLTVVNNYSGTYPIVLEPEYQNIEKGDQDQTNVVPSTNSNAKFDVEVENPTICMHYSKNHALGEKDFEKYDPDTYAKIGSVVIFGYKISMNTPVERNNLGEQLIDSSDVDSSISLKLGTEKLLCSYDTEQDVKQFIGVPWLMDIPYLKYLFGTSTEIKLKNRFYVTVKGELIHPDTNNLLPGGMDRDVELVKQNFQKTADTSGEKVINNIEQQPHVN